jgi:hypothetical protein
MELEPEHTSMRYTFIPQMLLPKYFRLTKASLHGPEKTELYSACVLPKSHHLAGRVTTPSPVVREPASAEKAYRTTAVKKKSRFRTSPVNTGYYLDIWVASVRRRRRWRRMDLLA